jgi:hypothetical protein
VEPDRVPACELAWEVHCHGYWSQVRRPDGTAYDCEKTYFRDVLGLASWRTAYKRLAIGRMLLSFGEPERLILRAAIAEVGLAKAAVLGPAIERFGEWKAWLQLALQCPTAVLQARVSQALEALPRGRELSPPGERFRRDVLGAMPDIEAMELVERFFEIGAKVVGSPHPVAIFLAGCRECVPEWEIQVAGRRRARQGHDHDPEDSDSEFCPRGQSGRGIKCYEGGLVPGSASADGCARARGREAAGPQAGPNGRPFGSGCSRVPAGAVRPAVCGADWTSTTWSSAHKAGALPAQMRARAFATYSPRSPNVASASFRAAVVDLFGVPFWRPPYFGCPGSKAMSPPPQLVVSKSPPSQWSLAPDTAAAGDEIARVPLWSSAARRAPQSVAGYARARGGLRSGRRLRGARR